MITNQNNPKPALPPLLKVREVARVLSLSQASVRLLLASGDLTGSELSPTPKRPKKKQRVHLRITRESLAKFYKKRFGHEIERALQTPFQN
jgi:transposase